MGAEWGGAGQAQEADPAPGKGCKKQLISIFFGVGGMAGGPWMVLIYMHVYSPNGLMFDIKKGEFEGAEPPQE